MIKPPKRPPLTILITQTYVQDKYYMEELGLDKKTTIVPNNKLGLMGFVKQEGDKVIFKGTWYNRRDLETLYRQLRVAGFTEEELYDGSGA